MLELLGLIVAGGSAAVGYVKSRRFVRERLRFVDAAQTAHAPWIAGAAAAAVAAPIVWLLPVVSAGTAIVFGVGVGTGVAAGARDIRRLTSY